MDNTFNANYEIINKDNINDVLSFFAKNQLDEPLSKALGLTQKDTLHLAENIFSERVITDGFSTIARNKDTNEIIALSHSEDILTERPYEKVTRDLQLIFSMWESVKSRYLENNPANKNSLLHRSITWVLKPYRNTKIYPDLIERSHSIALENNFDGVITETSRPALNRILQNIGYSEVLAINYKEHMINNRKIFSEISEKYNYGSLMLKTF